MEFCLDVLDLDLVDTALGLVMDQELDMDQV